jgi:DNA-binding transcriptional regulator YiaG
MGENKSSGLTPVAIQLRIKWQIPASDGLNPMCLELWDYIAPLADCSGSDAEGASCDRLPRAARVEVLKNGLFQHAADYSMLNGNVKYANEEVAYSNEMQTMGDRIRLLRQAKALSQSQLAERVGVTAGAISQWESGLTKNIKLETFLRLCEELGTVPHYLIFGPGKQPGAGRKQA